MYKKYSRSINKINISMNSICLMNSIIYTYYVYATDLR